MERTKIGWRLIVNLVSSVVAISAVFVTVYAQQGSQTASRDDFVVSSKRSITGSSTGSVGSKVTLQLTFDNGMVFQVTQLEGELIRVERNNSRIGIVAHIDDNGNQVRADVFKGPPEGAREISIKGRIPDISSLEIGRVASNFPITELGLTVAVLRIEYAASLPNDAEEHSRFHLFSGPGQIGGNGECCVICDGVRVCGCQVEAPCGSCCTGTCC